MIYGNMSPASQPASQAVSHGLVIQNSPNYLKDYCQQPMMVSISNKEENQNSQDDGQ